MSRIQWNQELSVGVKEVDDQHKELIAIANTVLEAVEKGGSTAVIEKFVKKLRDYTVFHFNSEEELMQSRNYPKLSEHKTAHSRLKNIVKDLQRTTYEGKPPTPSQLMRFLKDWLLNHILTFDRDFARFLREQPKEETWVEIGGSK